jgi:hypothetical protein
MKGQENELCERVLGAETVSADDAPVRGAGLPITFQKTERMEVRRMAQQYDVSLKLLFHHSKGLLARRLFGGPVVEWVNVEQPKVTNLRVDLLARLEDGSLRHVEVQAKNDPDMGRRLAEYHLGFLRLLGQHVEQVVLYVGREPLRMSPVFETPSMRYAFRLLDMREVDGEPLVASEDWGDNLLALLTSVEQERVLQRVERQIRSLQGEEQETAARLFVIVSGIIGLEGTVVRRLNMIDIMENKILGPAILKGEVAMLVRLLKKRFGAVPDWVTEKLASAQEAELMEWCDRALDAQTLGEVFER